METLAKENVADRIHELLGVRLFKLPPDGFEPLQANERELRVYGIPSKPEPKAHPEVRKLWERMMSRSLYRLQPQFGIRTDRRHGVAQAVTAGTSPNWSGSAIQVPAQDSATWVMGQWTVPSVVAPGSGNYYSAAWVGIDGTFGSQDVLQVGTEHDIRNGSYTLYPWWEWFPSNPFEVQITNLPVQPGHVMFGMVCVESPTSGTIYLLNVTTGATVSFGVTAQAPTSLVGNVAEWIVEAPAVNGIIAPLAAYGAVYFDMCFAGTRNGAFLNGGKGTPITMTNSSGKGISTPEIESDEMIEVLYTG
jgi:hypothetical protein